MSSFWKEITTEGIFSQSTHQNFSGIKNNIKKSKQKKLFKTQKYNRTQMFVLYTLKSKFQTLAEQNTAESRFTRPKPQGKHLQKQSKL